MHTPTLHSVLILMNVSRINSQPLRHAVLIFQPVNQISYFLSAFSLLHFTIMLHSIFESHFPKNHRQMMEQRHRTETKLLIFFPPKLNTTQAIYGTFIPLQILNASTIYSLRHWIQKPTQNQCSPDNIATRIHSTLNHAGHSVFSVFSYFNPLEIRKISNHFHTKAFSPRKIPRFRPIFSKKISVTPYENNLQDFLYFYKIFQSLTVPQKSKQARP